MGDDGVKVFERGRESWLPPLREHLPFLGPQGTLSEEGPSGAVPMMAPPMGQPQFFDPSQFRPPSNTSANPARRAGPGRRSFPANR